MVNSKPKTRSQSLDAVSVSDALLDGRTVQTITGMGRTAIYTRCKAGTFPQPLRLSARCTRWRSGDVMDWLKAQASQQLGPAA